MRCDKCGREVPKHNDAVVIESIKNGVPATVLFYGSRHFLPTEDCEGSPSRAQYIEGQPRDTRGYPYEEKHEYGWRRAFREAQEEYGSS